MLKKLGEYLKGVVVPPPSEDDLQDMEGNGVFTRMNEEQKKLILLRQKLISAIGRNSDSSDIVKNIIENDTTDFSMKYAMLDVKNLLDLNKQTVKNLQNIVTGLSMIARYAQLILKKNGQYKAIPLSNEHVQRKILPMNGSRHILSQLGYTVQTETAFSFNPGIIPNEEEIINLLADMLLFKAEMKYYLSGSHISPQQIDALLPPNIVAQLKQGEGAGSEILETSMQSLSLETITRDSIRSQNTNSSNENSSYYSARSGRDSKELVSNTGPQETTWPHTEDEAAAAATVITKVVSPVKDEPKEIVTMQDFDVEERGGSESTSMKNPSSGFKVPCSLCNEEAQLMCKMCMNKMLCENCNETWHSHPSRRNHPTEKISEIDPYAISTLQDNIVKGPYGIIANQAENPAVQIGRKLKAIAGKVDAEIAEKNKAKIPLETHDGIGETEGEFQASGGGSSGAGNMPDFGSIMSGNMEGFSDGNKSHPQTPKLLSRGISDHMKMPVSQHSLPQFLQDGSNNSQQQQQQQFGLQPPPPSSSSSSSSSSSMQPQNPPPLPMHSIPQMLGQPLYSGPIGQGQVMSAQVTGQPLKGQVMSAQVTGQPLRSVSQVQGQPLYPVPSGQSRPISSSIPQVQGQPLYSTSVVQGQPLYHQMPPSSSSSSSSSNVQQQQQQQQQYSRNSNNNQLLNSPNQFYYPQQPQQQYYPQQQQQHSFFPAPPPSSSASSSQTYALHSPTVEGSNVFNQQYQHHNHQQQQQQQRFGNLQYPNPMSPPDHRQQPQSQAALYRDNSHISSSNINTPVPDGKNYYQDDAGINYQYPHQQQQQQQQHQQQHQHQFQQQQRYAQSIKQHSEEDKEETIVQYPSPKHMMAGGISPSQAVVNNSNYPPRMQHQQQQHQHYPSLQMPQTPFSPKYSQTYPQLSSMSAISTTNQDEEHPHQPSQKQDKPASRPPMHTSKSTPAFSATPANPAFKLIQRIISEPLPATRQSLCSFKIEEISSEIQELQNEIDCLLLEEDEDYTKEITLRTKKKKEMLKTKKELQKLKKDLDSSTDESMEVYFPPCMNSTQALPVSTMSLDTTKTGIKRSPTKEVPGGIVNTATVTADVVPPIPVTSLPAVSNMTGGRGWDFQGKQQQQSPQMFKPNLPGEESMTENATFHKEPSMIQRPQISLKADNSIPKWDGYSPSPHQQWQCEHCTFFNDENSHACVICHKTTAVKQYTTTKEDVGQGALAPLDVPLEHQLDIEGNNSNPHNDFVCEKVQNRILHMQKEEEKMMAEKKKAWADYEEEKKQSPTSTSKGFTSEDDRLQATPQGGFVDGSNTSNGGVKTTAAAGFSDVADGNRDPGLAQSSNSTGSSAPSTMGASLALERLKEAQACDRLTKDGQAFIRCMKEADIAGYPVDAVPIAISFSNPQTTSVMEWLNKHWEKHLLKIVKEVTDIAASREQNSIGKLSMEEAQTACIECQGNLRNAVGVCIRKREELFKHLSAIGNYPREDILQAMYTQQGDREKAEQELVQQNLGGFVERIWNKVELLQQPNFIYQEPPLSPNVDICVSVSSSAVELDTFQRLIMDKNVDRDRRIRMMLVEAKLKSWGRGELVIDILDNYQHNQHVTLEDIVEAVRNCQDRKNALVFLKQECQICFDDFPMNKIRNLSFCQCKLCGECLTGYFMVAIKEKHVRHWTCPICSLPDMNNEDLSLDYVNMLQMSLNLILSAELMNLFEEKVRDFSLQKDPSFRWCAHCGNGFLVAPNIRAGSMTCNICHKKTCFTCKRMWEPQHEGLSCEEFDQWKIDNDPNNQAIGLAKHLQENGIDCPKCKMRYSLAKGGCMHFKCPQCGHEFCSGCYQSFNQQGVCKKYKSCETLGFHCHHPRDCYSFLRDRLVEDLQKLLESNKVPFNVQVPEDQEDKNNCPVMEQKEEGIAKKDERCGKQVELNMAGLCQSHYKEYLTGLINKHALDPVHLMELQELVNQLKRYELDLPSRGPSEADLNFKGKLIKIIQEKIPLNRKKLDR